MFVQVKDDRGNNGHLLGPREGPVEAVEGELLAERQSGILLHPTSLPGALRHRRAGTGGAPLRRLPGARPARRSGRCCPSGPPATATRPTSASRPSPAIRCSSASTRCAEDGLLTARRPARRRAPRGRGRLRRGDRLQAAAAGEGLRRLREERAPPRARDAFEAFCREEARGSTTSRSSWPSRTRTAARPGTPGSEAIVTPRARRRWRRRGREQAGSDPRARSSRSSSSSSSGRRSARDGHDARDPDHGRHPDLRGPRQRRRLGASRALPPRRRRHARPSLAGVPPDYFSATGQLWGNPLYRWDVLARTGYRLVDRALPRDASAWSTSCGSTTSAASRPTGRFRAASTTAVNGRWVKGPGRGLFDALQAALGPLPIVAENLGVITPEVEALRERFGFPGMAILQFAFGDDAQANDFLPHNYPRNRVVYTGDPRQRHDRGLVDGRGGGLDAQRGGGRRRERDFALRYLGERRPRDPLGLHPRRAWPRWPTPRSSRCRTCSGWAARRA